MADIELVIKIPERIHYGIEKGITVNGSEASQILIDAVKNGKPLPKGHGRLIDGDALYDQYRYADYDFNKTMEYAPTIIEADRAESGDKE